MNPFPRHDDGRSESKYPGKFDGERLVAPEQYRIAFAEELCREVEELAAIDETTLSHEQLIANTQRQAKLLLAIEKLFDEPIAKPINLQRFRSDEDLDDVWRGTPVVFMGYDRALHKTGLDILTECFKEEGLVMGQEYLVMEVPDDIRGYCFAIKGPAGRKLYLDYTYFGRRVGEDWRDRFVTDWAN
jgi:hypothetical protein